jgi:hypothetical protein
VAVRSLAWLVAAGALVVAFAAAGGSELLTRIPDVGEAATDAIRDHTRDQGSSQISAAEFLQVRRGATAEQVRALVGSPERETRVRVEGVQLDCLYYGVVGASGAFQLCFADDRLVSRFRYDPARP